MARGATAEKEWDYSGVKDPTIPTYPKGYYKLKIETPTEDHTDDGRRYFEVPTTIVAPEKYEDSTVNLRFYVGTEDDEEGVEPETWTDPKNYDAQKLVRLMNKAGLIKKDGSSYGKAKPPFKLVFDLEGEEVIDFMTTGVVKKGDRKGQDRQYHEFWAVGEREPGLLGATDEAPSRRGKKHEDDEDDDAPRGKDKGGKKRRDEDDEDDD